MARDTAADGGINSEYPKIGDSVLVDVPDSEGEHVGEVTEVVDESPDVLLCVSNLDGSDTLKGWGYIPTGWVTVLNEQEAA